MLNDLNQRGGKHRALCPKHLKENRQKQARGYYLNRRNNIKWWSYWQKRNHENYIKRKFDGIT